jgi:hypothetical protein
VTGTLSDASENWLMTSPQTRDAQYWFQKTRHDFSYKI